MSDNENFEKRLLKELRQVAAENPTPAPEAEPTRTRPYGRFAAAGAGLAAVVAGIAIYTSTGDNTTSAYAVESQPDGKVSVEITDLTEAAGLEASLAAAGVPAEVSMAPVATVCGVKVEPDNESDGEWKSTSPAPTVEPDGDVIRSVPAIPAVPAESGETGIPAEATAVTVPIEIKEADASGASFSIDPETIAKGDKVIIAPTAARSVQAIPAGAPSAPPIEVSIGAPGEPPC